MITDRLTYRWLWSCLIAGGLLLTGCTDSSESDPMPEPEPEQKGYPLELRSVTRTEGATQIEGANCPVIKALLTSASEKLQIGTFSYSGTGWESTLSVKEERQYYLYGFMPQSLDNGKSAADTVAFTKPENVDFSEGIDMTFKNLPAITSTDICVVIGVQRLETETSLPANVKEGSFGYLSGIVGKNYVNLLMGHLYSGLELQFKIDAAYAQLRSIHLKEIQLKSAYNEVNATVKLRNEKGIDQATFTKVGSTGQTMDILKSTDAELVLDKNYTNSPLKIDHLAYCVPSIFAENASLSITTTYDVYDRKKNLGQRISENKLRIEAAALKPGQKKTVILTVQPTYLYVLSDEDLDNPVITIN